MRGPLAWSVALLALGCQTAAPRSTSTADAGAGAPLCSQLHREILRWQNGRRVKIRDCGPDVSGLLELTPVGNHRLLFRRRFAVWDDLWEVTADAGAIIAPPSRVQAIVGADTAGFALLPGTPPHVLVYDPRSTGWRIFDGSLRPSPCRAS